MKTKRRCQLKKASVCKLVMWKKLFNNLNLIKQSSSLYWYNRLPPYIYFFPFHIILPIDCKIVLFELTTKRFVYKQKNSLLTYLDYTNIIYPWRLWSVFLIKLLYTIKQDNWIHVASQTFKFCFIYLLFFGQRRTLQLGIYRSFS